MVLDIASELVEKKDYKTEDVHLISPSISDKILPQLRELNYTLHNQDSFDDLDILPDNFILLNTSAISNELANPIFEMLGSGYLKDAFWFIHENDLSYMKRFDGVHKNIVKLINSGSLKIFAPSQECAKLLGDYFDGACIPVVSLFVDPTDNFVERHPDDFSHIDFYIAGNPSTGLKGQLLFYTAIQTVYYEYLKKHPSRYRSFAVYFTTIDADWISQIIIILAKSMPEVEFSLHPTTTFREAQHLQKLCNVTVCTSLNESFCLYVAEGMTMGHVLLRNNTADYKRQIKDGVNGFLFEKHDFNALVEKIELMLNVRKTSNEALCQMSKESTRIIAPFTTRNYLGQFFAPDKN